MTQKTGATRSSIRGTFGIGLYKFTDVDLALQINKVAAEFGATMTFLQDCDLSDFGRFSTNVVITNAIVNWGEEQLRQWKQIWQGKYPDGQLVGVTQRAARATCTSYQHVSTRCTLYLVPADKQELPAEYLSLCDEVVQVDHGLGTRLNPVSVATVVMAERIASRHIVLGPMQSS